MSSTQLHSQAQLLPLKLWYLFYFAAQFTQLFIPLILDRVMNFSPSTAGFMMAARRLVIFFVAPLFTWLCDATLKHRSLLITAHLAYYFATFLLAHVRSLPTVLIILLIREACVSGCEPAINNAAIAKLHQVDAHVDAFGQLRLWGSIGWGLSSLLASFVIDKFFASDYVVAFYIQIAIGFVVIALVAFSLDLSPTLFERRSHWNHNSSESVINVFVSSSRALYGVVNVLSQGVIFGVLQMTLFLYFAELGVSTSALGLSVLLACVTEGTIFLYTSKIFNICGGAQQTFNVGLVLNCAALVSFSLIHLSRYTTVLFIIVTVFNGGTYALFLTAALTITSEMAPPSLTTTAQGTLAALYSGIGPAVGSLISGMGYQTIGAPRLYCMLAFPQLAIVCVGLIMFGKESGRRCEDEDECTALLEVSVESRMRCEGNELVPIVDSK